MLKYISISASLFLGTTISAQQIPFINYTPKDGLVNNRVRKMMQDSKGQLYFLTFGGMSIYDGTGFTNFTRADGLASDIVNDAIEMGNDSIWVAPNTKELNYFSKGSIKKFKTADGFCPIINSFYKNKNGQLFIASDEGLFIFINNQFKKLPLFKNEQDNKDEFINTIYQAGNYLLILTDQALGKFRGNFLLYDLNSKTIIHNLDGINATSITEIEEDVWLTSIYGIKVLDKKLLLQGKIEFKSLPSKFNFLNNKRVGLIFYDSQKNVWISQTNAGVIKIEQSGIIKEYTLLNGLLSNMVTGLFEDKEASLWLMNDNWGIQKLVNNHVELSNGPFGSYVSSLTTNVAGDSVYYWDMPAKNIYLQTALSIKKYTVKNINNEVNNLTFSGNNLYLNSSKNIYHIAVSQLKNVVVIPRLINTYDSGFNSNRSVVDANGVIIIQGKNHLTSIINPSLVSRSRIKYFIDEGAVDSKGRIWFASRENELYTMSTSVTDPLNYLQLIKDFSKEINIKAPRSVTIDKSDNVWVGTREDGLYCYNVNNNLEIKLLKHFSKKDGLIENFITYLYCDKAGTIWAGTSSGIDKITFSNNEYLVDNISKRNNLYPFIFSIKEDDNHNILALTIDGKIVKIAAEENTPSSFIPQLFIKLIKAGDKNISPTGYKTFSYTQNNISVIVTSPAFYDEKQIKYSYILKGSGNNNWSQPTTNAELNFNSLSPGSYSLQIKASYPASRYPDQTINYSFSISPPWWQSWWFSVIAVLFFVASIWLIIQSFFKRKLQKQKMLLENKQAIEKERTRIATDIHDDLGSGLSRIRYLGETIRLKTGQQQNILPDIEKIAGFSDEMVDKMNEIVWALNEKNDSLAALIYYIRSYTAEYLSANIINCEVVIPDNIPEKIINGETRRNIFLSVKESLHNIVKHARATKTILQVTLDNHITISITDNGSGIQWDDVRPFSNGISNIKQRMEELKGTVSFQIDKGTRMVLKIPLH